jgi:tetratricopeptide (TPR) repeat protein
MPMARTFLDAMTEGDPDAPWFARMAMELLALRRALNVVPDNVTVRALLAEREATEQQEFEAFCARRRAELAGGPGTMSLEQFLVGEETENTVDYLLKQLEEVRRRRPQEAPPEDSSAEDSEGPQSAKIITVTLAEIYVSQGQFAEAIAAYRKLTELRPEEESRYTARIRELEAQRREGQ